MSVIEDEAISMVKTELDDTEFNAQHNVIHKDDIKIEWVSPSDHEADEIRSPLVQTSIKLESDYIPKSEITFDDYQFEQPSSTTKSPATREESAFGHTIKELIYCDGRKGNNYSNEDKRAKRRRNFLSCDECKETFFSQTSLNLHKRIHTCVKPFSCDDCEDKFSCHDSLIRHKQIHLTLKKSFVCDVCKANFSSKESLDEHLRLHPDEKPFYCDECGKKFTSKSNLTQHIRIHIGRKPCEECQVKLSSVGSLNVQKRISAGKTTYTCNVCERKFTFTCQLIKHLRRHTHEKPFSCDECEMKFPAKSDLVRHNQIHTDEMLLPCDECGRCGKKFSSQVYLNRHKKFPLACLIYRDKNKSDLVRHKQIHTDEKLLSCEQCERCGKKFSSQGHLNRHEKFPLACLIYRDKMRHC